MSAMADYPLPQQRSGRVHRRLTLSGPAFSVVRQARGGLRGPDAKNQG